MVRLTRRAFLQGALGLASLGVTSWGLWRWWAGGKSDISIAQTQPRRITYRLAASLPLSGDYQNVGKAYQESYQFFIKLIARDPYFFPELVVQDNGSDPERCARQYEEFIAQGAALLLPTAPLELARAAFAVTERHKMILPLSEEAWPDLWQAAPQFLFAFQPALITEAVLPYLRAIRAGLEAGRIQSADAPRTVALVRAAEERSRLLVDRSRLQQHFDALGIRVVFEEEYPTSPNWADVGQRLAAANADLLLIATRGGQLREAAALIEAVRRAGYQPKGVWLSEGANSRLGQALGSTVNGIAGFAPWHPKVRWYAGAFHNDDFIEEFKRLFRREPNLFHALAFGTVYTLFREVLGSCHSWADPVCQAIRVNRETLQAQVDQERLRQWMLRYSRESSFNSILGYMRWDERGLRLNGVVGPSTGPREFLVAQWQAGAQELVWPSEVVRFQGAEKEEQELVKTAELLWPKPRW